VATTPPGVTTPSGLIAPSGVVAARTERHLRERTGEAQETTTVELFFDLVYVLAVTQLSHLLISHHPSWTTVWHMTFLLLVVWWAWIYTTWMVNWLDPESTPVRLVIVAVGLASLLMAAALPDAFTSHGVLFAGAYVGLQVGRNLGGALLLGNNHALGQTFRRLLGWSAAAGALWLGGAFLDGPQRILLWAPALALELIAPLIWYWVPGKGTIPEIGQSIEGSHFAERCQGFVIIALGESIVVTGATAATAGLTTPVVGALAIAFLQTSALWWLYFGEAAVHSRREMATRDDVVDLARDAYTYLHLPIVAGIILSAVGADYLTSDPGGTLDAGQAAITLAGPIVYLTGELLFRRRMIHTGNPKRYAAIAALVAVGLVATSVSVVVLGLLVTAILVALALWEYAPPSLDGVTTPGAATRGAFGQDAGS
jgi:low temperature requirement protein LtrA